MVPSAGWGTGTLRAGSWRAICCATAACWVGVGEPSGNPLGCLLVGLGAGSWQSPVSALPAGRVLTRPWSPLASTCQHPRQPGDVTHPAGAEAVRGDSPCLRCPVPAGQTPPQPPLLLPAHGLGKMASPGRGAPSLQGTLSPGAPWGSPARRGLWLCRERAVPRDKGSAGTTRVVLPRHHRGAGAREAGEARCRQGLGRQTRLPKESASGSRSQAPLHGNPARAYISRDCLAA